MITDHQIELAEERIKQELKLLPVVNKIIQILKRLPEKERFKILASAAAYHGINIIS